MQEKVDELQRAYSRVQGFSSFDPGQRPWWIYLRASVERRPESDEDPAIRAAYDRLKSFPENLPDERLRWHELRVAVEDVLARHLSA